MTKSLNEVVQELFSYGSQQEAAPMVAKLTDTTPELNLTTPNLQSMRQYDAIQEDVYNNLIDADTVGKDMFGTDTNVRLTGLNAPEIKYKNEDEYIQALASGTTTPLENVGQMAKSTIAQELVKAKVAGKAMMLQASKRDKYNRLLGNVSIVDEKIGDEVKGRSLSDIALNEGSSNVWIDRNDEFKKIEEQSNIEKQIINAALSKAQATNDPQDWARYENLIQRSKAFGIDEFKEGDIPLGKVVGNTVIDAGEIISKAGNQAIEWLGKAPEYLYKTYRPGKGWIQTEDDKELEKVLKPAVDTIQEFTKSPSSKDIEESFKPIREGLNSTFNTDVFSKLEPTEIPSVAKALHDYKNGREGAAVVGIANSILQGIVNGENLTMMVPWAGMGLLIAGKAKEFKDDGASDEKALAYGTVYSLLNKLNLKASVGQVKNIANGMLGRAAGNTGLEILTENVQTLLEEDAGGRVKSLDDVIRLAKRTTLETAPSAIFGGGASVTSDDYSGAKGKVKETVSKVKEAKVETKLEEDVRQATEATTKDIREKLAKVVVGKADSEAVQEAKETKAVTATELVDKFNQLEVLKREAEELNDDATVQDIIAEQSLIADKLVAEADLGKVGSAKEMTDILETVIENNPEIEDKELERLIKTAGESYVPAKIKAIRETVKKNRDAVEQDVTVGKHGYKTLGKQLRSMMKQPKLFTREIANVKDRLSNLRATQQQRKAVVEKYVKELETKLQNKDYLGRVGKDVEIPLREYKTQDGTPYKIHVADVQKRLADKNYKGGAYGTIADIQRTIQGINRELRRSGVVLEADKVTVPDVKRKRNNKHITEATVFGKANKIVAFKTGNKKVDSVVSKWVTSNKGKVNKGTYIEQDIVAVIVPAFNSKFSKDNLLTSMKAKDSKAVMAKIAKKLTGVMEAKAKIVISVIDGRTNAEKAVAEYLIENNYVEVNRHGTKQSGTGIFIPAENAREPKVKEETTKVATETAKQVRVETKLPEVDEAEAGNIDAKTITEETTVDQRDMVLSESISNGTAEVTSKGRTQVVDINKIVKKTGKMLNVMMMAAEKDLVAPLQSYMRLASNNFYSLFTDVNTNMDIEKFALYDSPARGLLFDKNGKIRANVAATIMLAADEYIATSSKMLNPYSKEDIARMMGITEFEVTRDMMTFFREHGTFKKTMANSIAKTVMKNLGLKANDSIDSDTYDKLLADVGHMGILYLEAAKIVEVTKVKTKKYASVIDDRYNTYNTNATVSFVRMNKATKSSKVNKAKERIEEIMPLAGIEINMLKGALDKPAKHKGPEIARRGIGTKVGKIAKTALDKLRNVEYTPVAYGVQWIKENRERAMELMGYVGGDSLADLDFKSYEAQVAINEKIEQSIDDLIANDKESMYFDWFFTGNGRFILDSNTLNPQTDKLLHRFLIVPKSMLKTLDKTSYKHMRPFYDAISQATGSGIDKKRVKETIKQAKRILEIDYWRLENALSDTKELDAINKELKDEGYAKIKVENLGHFLQAVEAVANYQQSEDGTFDTSISAEYDAITSGFAIRLLQMPILRDIHKWLEKVGVFMANDEVPMSDKLANGLVDSYQTLAKGISPETMEVDGKVDTLGLWDMLKDKLPQMEDGVVSSELRSLFKGPFMTFNYAAGLRTIKKALGYAIIDDIIKDMTVNEGKGKYADLYTKLAKLTDREGKKLYELLREKDYDLITVKIGNKKSTLGNELRKLIEGTYGKAVEEALLTEFQPFVAANNTINNAFRAMFAVFNIKYQEKLEEYKKIGPITSAVKDKIIEELLDSMPVIKGPDSESVQDGVMIISDKIAGTTPATGAAQTRVKDKKVKSKVIQSVRRELDAAVNAGSVIPIHFIDGATMAALINFIGTGQFIHDAIIVPNDMTAEAIMKYNEEWLNKGISYDMVGAIADAMERVAATIEKDKLPTIKTFLKEGEYMVGKDKEYKPGEYNISFADIQSMINQLATGVSQARANLFNNNELTVMQMVGFEGTSFTGVKQNLAVNNREFKPIAPTMTDKAKETEAKAERQEKETKDDLVEFTGIGLDIAGIDYAAYGDYVDAVYEDATNRAKTVFGKLGNVLVASYNNGGNTEVLPIKKYKINLKNRSVTIYTENAQYTFGENMVNSNETNGGMSVFDERMAEVTAELFRELDYAGVSGSSKEAKKAARSKAGFVKLTKEVHRNVEGMKRLAKKLELLSLAKSSPEHVQHLLGLFDKINPVFLTKMTTYLNTAAEKTGGIVNYKAKEIMVSISKTDAEMSGMEAYTHEIMHSYMGYAFRSDNPEAKRIKAKLLKLRRMASNIIKPKDLIPNQVLDSKEAMKKAQAQWDYMFNNANTGLEEFVALTLTNEKIKKLLSGKISELYGEKKSIYRHILDLAIKLLDMITGLDIPTSDKSIYDNVFQLSFELAQYNNNRLKQVQPKGGFFASLDNAKLVANKTVSNAIKAVIDKATDYKLKSSPRDGSILNYSKWLVKALPKLLLDSNYRPQLKTVLASVGASPSGILQNILKDASTPNRLERAVERLGLMADKIDSMREDIKEAVRKELMGMFTKKPTTVELSALTLGILDTDISSLEGYSLGQLKKLFMNEEVLKEKIKVVTTAIGRKDRKNLNWLLTQSKGLGRYMATHQSNIAQNLNAENIVKMFLTDKPLVKADKEMVQLVDELATLYAVSYTPTATRELVGKIIDKEPKAVEAIINTHRLIKEESAKRLFINNKAHIIKGYTRAIDDNMTEIAVKPLSMRKDMENEGFKLVSVLEKDPMDRSGVAMGVYKSKSFTTMPYNRAATRLTDIHKRGTSLTDVYFKANAPMAAEQAKADKKRIDRLRRQAVKDMMEGKFNVDKGNTLSPIIDQTGNVVDYRYNMAKSTKRELLNQDITAHKVLAHMLGNVQDKMETEKHNEIVLDTILDDMKKNYVEGSIIGKNGERYVTITKDSKDERIAEIYSILPENIKTAIARSDAKQIAVREDLLSMYFGFRDPSVFNSKVFKAILPQEVLAIGRVAGKIWEEVVSISKVDIVIRTPMVFIDNIKSNFMWAYATGTNVFTVAKLQLESLKEVLDYVNKSRELSRLKIAKATGNIGKKDVSKIGMLQEELNNNPAKVLIDAGMYQTIIEDIERSDLEAKSVLGKKFRWVTDKVPEWVKVGADMLYISPATAPFKFMVKAIQYSDLVARLAQYKILTKQGVRPRQALDEVLDVFVNYNKPSSSTEEWANQMGLMMFTKYFKRVQRAINIGVREYPVTFLANMAMQEFVVGDIPGVEDSNVFSKNYGATTYVPTELLDHMYRAVMPTSAEIGMGDVKLF